MAIDPSTNLTPKDNCCNPVSNPERCVVTIPPGLGKLHPALNPIDRGTISDFHTKLECQSGTRRPYCSIERRRVKETPGLDETIEIVDIAFKSAAGYGLQVEVIASAFIALQNNPDLTILEAISAGLLDWDVNIK